jgi:hypothetical protein
MKFLNPKRFILFISRKIIEMTETESMIAPKTIPIDIFVRNKGNGR